jgi:hypothetical protein
VAVLALASSIASLFQGAGIGMLRQKVPLPCFRVVPTMFYKNLKWSRDRQCLWLRWSVWKARQTLASWKYRQHCSDFCNFISSSRRFGKETVVVLGLSASGDTFQNVLTCSDDEATVCEAKSLSCFPCLHLQGVESMYTSTVCTTTDCKTVQASCVPSRPNTSGRDQTCQRLQAHAFVSASVGSHACAHAYGPEPGRGRGSGSAKRQPSSCMSRVGKPFDGHHGGLVYIPESHAPGTPNRLLYVFLQYVVRDLVRAVRDQALTNPPANTPVEQACVVLVRAGGLR